jgi:hypothetical protein
MVAIGEISHQSFIYPNIYKDQYVRGAKQMFEY